jgi:hypothetical protein
MNPGRQTISDKSKLPEDVTLDVPFMRIGEYQRFVEFLLYWVPYICTEVSTQYPGYVCYQFYSYSS